MQMKKLSECVPKKEDIQYLRILFLIFGFSLFGLGIVIAVQLTRWGILT